MGGTFYHDGLSCAHVLSLDMPYLLRWSAGISSLCRGDTAFFAHNVGPYSNCELHTVYELFMFPHITA